MNKSISDLAEMAKNGVIVHNGNMHADDVFSVSLLLVCGVIPEKGEGSVWKRLPEPQIPKDFNGLILDIGRGEFDHHQLEGYQVRKNDDGSTKMVMAADGKEVESKYATFGLLWKDIGFALCKRFIENPNWDLDENKIAQIAFDDIERSLVEPIDLTDNYGQVRFPNPLNYLIAGQNVSTNPDCDFYVATTFVKNLLRSAIHHAVKTATLKVEAETIIEQNAAQGYAILDHYIPGTAFRGSAIRFIAMKSNRDDSWTILATDSAKAEIPDVVKEMEGFMFLHPQHFICGFDTKEHASAAIAKIA